MGVACGRVVAGLGVAAPLGHDEGFLVTDVPGGGVSAFCMLLVPTDVLVGADDVEGLSERVVDDLCGAAGGVLFRADEERCSDEAGGVELVGEIGHGGEVFGAGRSVG